MRKQLRHNLRKVWRSEPVEKIRSVIRLFYRSVEFSVMVRDLDAPDIELPRGRRSPVGDSGDFELEHGSAKHIAPLKATFSASKFQALKECIADPNTDVVIKTEGEEHVWCFMCHGTKRQPDSEYGIVLPIVEGRDIVQFDGWVNPEFRGTMIGILGTNTGNRWRRAEGFERLYVFVRKADVRSRRLHNRMSFREVGTIHHRRVGPFRFNRYSWEPGGHPEEARQPRAELARLGVQVSSPWAAGQEPETSAAQRIGYRTAMVVQQPWKVAERGPLGTGDGENRVYT